MSNQEIKNIKFNFNPRQPGKAPVRKNPPFQPTQGDFNKLFVYLQKIQNFELEEIKII